MRPLYDMTVIQIEATNACHLQCANCTRLVGHHRRPFFMDPDMVRRAIESLEGFPHRIGLMGGEPALHPRFPEICQIYQEMIPDRRRREFWTAGYKWNEYKAIIDATFDEDRISYNDHMADDGKHQPLLVAIDDIVEDKQLMWDLIDNCWVQQHWSASITPKGAFFCEVAAALDHALDGPGGYPVEKGWWQKTPEQFQEQVRRYCPRCSGALPLPRLSDMRGGRDCKTIDWISKGNAQLLEKSGSPKYKKGNVHLLDKTYTADDLAEYMDGWRPSCYRTFESHKPEDIPLQVGQERGGSQ